SGYPTPGVTVMSRCLVADPGGQELPRIGQVPAVVHELVWRLVDAGQVVRDAAQAVRGVGEPGPAFVDDLQGGLAVGDDGAGCGEFFLRGGPGLRLFRSGD